MALITFVALSLLTFTLADHGKTTRYWDCCKPSCAWSGKAPVVGPAHSCDRNDQWDWNANVKNACEDGGDAYACANTSPWVGANDISYGFAAVKLAGKGEWQTCCSCYELVPSDQNPSKLFNLSAITNTYATTQAEVYLWTRRREDNDRAIY
jgi:hypothetical protein